MANEPSGFTLQHTWQGIRTFSRSNVRSPVISIPYSKQPNAQVSLRLSAGDSLRRSGDIYAKCPGSRRHRSSRAKSKSPSWPPLKRRTTTPNIPGQAFASPKSNALAPCALLSLLQLLLLQLLMRRRDEIPHSARDSTFEVPEHRGPDPPSPEEASAAKDIEVSTFCWNFTHSGC